MVPSSAFALIIATLTAFAVRADVTPTEPGPRTTCRQGQKCRTAWKGDTNGKSANMAIELMTGDNFNMVHLTTVATGLDGNRDGSLQFDGLEVNPFSAVYFLQFSSPQSSNFTWTTRFAIADLDGKTVPPPEDKQPNGERVPWGTGHLVNPADAKPPPSFQNTSTSSASASASASQSSSSSSSNASALSSSSSATGTVQTSARITTVVAQQDGQSTGSPSSGNNTNGALTFEFNSAWQAVSILAVTASTFALYL